MHWVVVIGVSVLMSHMQGARTRSVGVSTIQVVGEDLASEL